MTLEEAREILISEYGYTKALTIADVPFLWSERTGVEINRNSISTDSRFPTCISLYELKAIVQYLEKLNL